MSALDLPLREQAARIAAGDLDAGELLDACLARIDERNPDLNAIVATFPDESRRMLDEAPEGPVAEEAALQEKLRAVLYGDHPYGRLFPTEAGASRSTPGRVTLTIRTRVASLWHLGCTPETPRRRAWTGWWRSSGT